LNFDEEDTEEEEASKTPASHSPESERPSSATSEKSFAVSVLKSVSVKGWAHAWF